MFILKCIYIKSEFLFKAASQLINNPLAQVGFGGGPIAPTTIAAALSAASYSGATAVTSSMPINFNEYYLFFYIHF